MSRITKSKFHKPFIALLVAVILVFSFEVNKPKAFVPLAWAGYVLGGMALETLVEIGVKSASKSIMKKKADDIAQKALTTGDFDFMKSKPYKNKDGSLVLKPTANDRAKMAWLIAGGVGGLIDMAFDGQDDGSCGYPVATGRYNIPTVVGTNSNGNPSSPLAQSLGSQYLQVSYSMVDIDTVNYYFTSKITGQDIKTYLVNHHVANEPINVTHAVVKEMIGDGDRLDYAVYYTYGALPYTRENYSTQLQFTDSQIGGYYIDSDDLAEDNGEDLVMCGGLSIPSTVKNIYPAPMNMADSYVMPNDDELRDRPIVIKNIMPVSESEGEIEWSEVENHYVTKNTTFDNDIETSYIDTYVKGDVINTTYNIQEINNYYTDKDEEVKVIDFKPDIEQTVIVDDDDDDASSSNPPPPAEVLDRTLISYAKQTYDYLGDSIDGAITSMRDITDDASGLVDYLDTSFRWLPAEWRALFGSAFILGVFAHFMRR